MVAGHTPHLLTEDWDCAPEGVHVHRVEKCGIRANRTAFFADEVERKLSGLKLDCVLSLERTRRQTVFRAGDGVYGAWLEERKRHATWWRRPFTGRGRFDSEVIRCEDEAYCSTNTGSIIVNSEMVRRDILRFYKFPPERIHLIRNGVDSHRMASVDREEARDYFGISAREFVICFVGSGWERKGLRYVMQAVKRVSRGRNVRLLVAGKGRRPIFAEKNVTFLGPVERIEMVYGASDLLVTLPIYEPSANVVSEALCAGLPVVTSRRNGAAELIAEGQNGSVVEFADDVQQASEALDFWISRDRGPMRLTESELTQHSVARNVQETVSLLRSVASAAW
jgi:UDP-glucose:(heptosyl)LPS alpha-1,3-glucosyltransferase